MSDEDHDVNIESDDESDDDTSSTAGSNPYMTQAEKRAHHNALERKRRDHIKDSFDSLRDSIPTLRGDKVGKRISASRAQVLKQATEYIQYMTKKNHTVEKDIDTLKKENRQLEHQVRALERAKASAMYSSEASANVPFADDYDSSDSCEMNTTHKRQKKSKV